MRLSNYGSILSFEDLAMSVGDERRDGGKVTYTMRFRHWLSLAAVTWPGHDA